MPVCHSETMLSVFQSGWAISLDKVPPSPDMAGSPLQPVLATVKRTEQAELASSVQLSFGHDPASPNAEQLADICQVLAQC